MPLAPSRADERFIVKTLSSREAGILARMLPQYHSYLAAFPHSLLTRFYGLHALSGGGRVGRRMFFVVMGNVLSGPAVGHTIHERYDLKGSWVGRHRKPMERGQLTECRFCGQNFRIGSAHLAGDDPNKVAAAAGACVFACVVRASRG